MMYEKITPTFSESVDPIELIPKDSVLNSLNQSREKRNARIEAKIQLSANRLSSKKCASMARDYNVSEENSCKENEFTPQTLKNCTPSNDDKCEDSYLKKYNLNVSSNQSLNINKSDLELISSNDYKWSNDDKGLKFELKDSHDSSNCKLDQNYSDEVSFEKGISTFKELFDPQITQKSNQISKLIAQEKERRKKDPKSKPTSKPAPPIQRKLLAQFKSVSDSNSKRRTNAVKGPTPPSDSSSLASQLHSRRSTLSKPPTPVPDQHLKSRNCINIAAQATCPSLTPVGQSEGSCLMFGTFNNTENMANGEKVNISSWISSNRTEEKQRAKSLERQSSHRGKVS